MNQALDFIFIFLLDGDYVTSVSHGNDLLLQKFGVGSARNIFLQRITDPIVFISHFSANIVKLIACRIRDHILACDTTRDLLFQFLIGNQMGEIFIQRSFSRMAFVSVLLGCSCRRKRSADGKNFSRQKNGTLVSTFHKGCHVRNSRKGRHAFGDLHGFCRVRFGKHSAHRSDRTRRTHLSGKSLRAFRRTNGRKHFSYFIKFERYDCSFKVSDFFHNLLLYSSISIYHGRSLFFGISFQKIVSEASARMIPRNDSVFFTYDIGFFSCRKRNDRTEFTKRTFSFH